MGRTAIVVTVAERFPRRLVLPVVEYSVFTNVSLSGSAKYVFCSFVGSMLCWNSLTVCVHKP